MKHKRNFILVLITIVALTSACTSVTKTTEESIETPTVRVRAKTATQTREPTATQRPTETPTPEPTATPTAKPVTPLSELIQNLSAESTAAILKIMAEQFPTSQENDSYNFFCIGGEFVTHEPRIQLPTGQEISQTIYCQYYDIEGNQRGVHIPVYSYDKSELNDKLVGYRTKYSNDAEDWQGDTDGYANAFATEEAAFGEVESWITRAGWSGPGHVIYLNFAMPTVENDFSLWSENGYFNEALQALMTESQLDEFAQSGDPSVLPQTPNREPLLLPVNISFESIYGAEQYETRDYDFD